MFKFFKGKEKGNVLYAPCKGKVVPLTEVPDPTFSEKLLGDGFAVIPTEGKVYAPADAEVTMVFDTLHAITLTSSRCLTRRGSFKNLMKLIGVIQLSII